jgi:hypothetical protein
MCFQYALYSEPFLKAWAQSSPFAMNLRNARKNLQTLASYCVGGYRFVSQGTSDARLFQTHKNSAGSLLKEGKKTKKHFVLAGKAF